MKLNHLDLLKDPKNQPLPLNPHVRIEEIPPASAILFYGGNKVTELVGERLYHYPFHPPAYHAALYLGDGLVLNVGPFKTVVELRGLFDEGERVDAIVYDIPEIVRKDIVLEAMRDVSGPKAGFMLPDYGFTDFLRFVLKWWKPSKKDICSENVVEHLAAHGVECSPHEAFNTAPWDLEEWARSHPLLASRYTIFQGEEYGAKNDVRIDG